MMELESRTLLNSSVQPKNFKHLKKMMIQRSNSCYDFMRKSNCNIPFNYSHNRFGWQIKPITNMTETNKREHCLKRHYSQHNLIKNNLNPSNLPEESSTLHLKCNYNIKHHKTWSITSLNDRYINNNSQNFNKPIEYKCASIADICNKSAETQFISNNRRKIVTKLSKPVRECSIKTNPNIANKSDTIRSIIKNEYVFKDICNTESRRFSAKKNSTSQENFFKNPEDTQLHTSFSRSKRCFKEAQNSQRVKEILVETKKVVAETGWCIQRKHFSKETVNRTQIEVSGHQRRHFQRTNFKIC